MVAPIISNTEVIGVFDLESDELNAYSTDDLQVLMLLASQVAIIIEKVMLHEQLIEKKRLEGQLEVARQVQLELLPARDPQLEGYDISAYNFPTEEVSGDYYDWVKIYDDQIGLGDRGCFRQRCSGGVADGVSASEFARGHAHWLFAAHFDGESELPALGVH